MKVNRYGQASTLKPPQIDQLIDKLPPGPYKMLATLLKHTAARVGEALLLTWEQISESQIVFIAPSTKTKQTREVPISQELRRHLDEWKKMLNPLSNKDYVFPSSTIKKVPMCRQGFDRQLRKACDSLGTKFEGVSTHTFRRSCLTTANKKGVNLRHLQAVSGHSSLNALQRYLEVDEESKQQAVTAFSD